MEHDLALAEMFWEQRPSSKRPAASKEPAEPTLPTGPSESSAAKPPGDMKMAKPGYQDI